MLHRSFMSVAKRSIPPFAMRVIAYSLPLGTAAGGRLMAVASRAAAAARSSSLSAAALPPVAVGTANFRCLREMGAVYVDKTQQLHSLVSDAEPKFISRPRKFGKSLMLSTIAEMLGTASYEEKLELFGGLWVAESEEGRDLLKERHEVLLLDFASLSYKRFEYSLELKLARMAGERGIFLQQDYMPLESILESLITGAAAQSPSGRIVILVDEYDKSITNVLDANGGSANELARQNIATLRSFFDVIKSFRHLQRFCLVTGVSKFALTGQFSGANQLSDLTLDTPEFAYTTLVGYTEAEIRRYFKARIDRLAARMQISADEVVRRVMRRHNGYSWGDRASGTVANSFAVNKTFSSGKFSDWWSHYGTSGWLAKLVRAAFARGELPFNPDVPYEMSFLANVELDTDGRHAFNLVDLLFQAGYITIASRAPGGDDAAVRLDFPNEETRRFIQGQLRDFLLETSAVPRNPHAAALVDALRQGKVKECFAYIDLWFSTMPRLKALRGKRNAELARSELLYDLIATFILQALLDPTTVQVQSGRQGAGGESDGLVVLAKERKVFVLEFKVSKGGAEEKAPRSGAGLDAAARDAIAQIDARQYATSRVAAHSGCDFYCVGIAIDAAALRVGTVLVRRGLDASGAMDDSEGEYGDVLKRVISEITV